MPKTVLITGATSGIGLELAKRYNDAGDNVIMIGRKNRQELEAPLFYQTSYLQGDLNQDGIDKKITELLKQIEIDAIDILIHNAAVGYYGDWLEQPEESINELLQVNVYAPIALTHALIPHLKKAEGKVVFISSIAANLAAQDYAVYAASKAALSGFARNLRLEHKDINVQTIYPGATRTPMHAKSGVPDGNFKLESFASAEDVAQQIQKVIATQRSEVTIGIGNQFLRGLGRFFAQPLDAIMRRQAQ